MKKLIPVINKTLEEKVRNEIPKRTYFYVSEVGKTPYQVIRNIYNMVEARPRLKRIFDNGNDVHERIIGYLEKQGVVKAKEVPVQNHLFKGRADAIVTIDDKVAVLEVKSMNKKRFDNMTKYCDRDTFLQLQMYMHLLNIDNGIIIVECKDDQRLKEFHMRRKPRVAKEIIDRFATVKDQYLKAGLQPI